MHTQRRSLNFFCNVALIRASQCSNTHHYIYRGQFLGLWHVFRTESNPHPFMAPQNVVAGLFCCVVLELASAGLWTALCGFFRVPGLSVALHLEAVPLAQSVVAWHGLRASPVAFALVNGCSCCASCGALRFAQFAVALLQGY